MSKKQKAQPTREEIEKKIEKMKQDSVELVEQMNKGYYKDLTDERKVELMEKCFAINKMHRDVFNYFVSEYNRLVDFKIETGTSLEAAERQKKEIDELKNLMMNTGVSNQNPL